MGKILEVLYQNTDLKVKQMTPCEKELVEIIKSKCKTEFEALEELRNNIIGDMLFEAYKQGFVDCITLNNELKE